jgi:hypothetical protein
MISREAASQILGLRHRNISCHRLNDRHAEADVSQRKRFPISLERCLVVSMIAIFVSAMSYMDRESVLIPALTVPSIDIKPAIAVSIVSVISTFDRFLERLGWPTVLIQPLIGPRFPPRWTSSA